MTGAADPISLALFRRVDDYADAVLKGAVTTETTIDKNTSIIIFYHNFFIQFFDHVLHRPITGFDERAQDQADRIRLTLDGPEHALVRQLIAQFENFCALRSDLDEGLYLPSNDDFLQFHEDYIPRLLESIGTWAASAGLPALAQRAKQALDHYNSALAYLRGKYG